MVSRHADEVAQATEVDERREQTLRDLKAVHEELLSVVAADFSDSPSPGLEALIRNAAVLDLQEKLRSAYRTRDRTMAAIWRIDELHSSTLNDKCKCGKALNACRDFNALAFFRETYYSWERRQIDLMRKNKLHGLPADHPESRKVYTNSWSWNGGPFTENGKR